MNRVGIYIRVSTEEQARIVDGSLVSQKSRLEEYVASQNRREATWGAVVDTYCDEAKSGKNMNRPEFQRLIEDVRLGRINLILATELSRFSRSIRDFCELWDLFKKYDTRFITLREQFDTTTAAGEMMVFNLINFAQFERKQTAERISANWASRAKRGLWNGGRVPMGYDRNPLNKGILIPNPEEAKTVRLIFDTFLEIGSLRQTCLKLLQMGIRTKSYVNKSHLTKGGGHFVLSSLYHFLTNQSFIGMREIGKKRNKVEFVPAAWPAIIDVSTFNSAQKLLEKNKNCYKPDEWKSYPYPMTEKVVCGECGKFMGGKSAHGRSKKHHYYEHTRKLKIDGVNHKKRCRLERVRAERTETMVLGFLKTILEKPQMIDDMLKAYNTQANQELPGLEGRLKTLESDIRQNERKTANLVTRLSELPPDVTADPIYAQMKLLNEKTTLLKESQMQLQNETFRVSSQMIDQNTFRERIELAVKGLESSPVEKQRPIFANVLKFVELHPTKVKLGIYAPLAARAGSTNVQLTATGGT